METTTEKTIEITPTWQGLVGALLLVYEHGNATGRATARAELQRMAKLADLYVAWHKES